MNHRSAWPVVLVALGVTLLGAGLTMIVATPRAVSTDLGPPLAASPRPSAVATALPAAPDTRTTLAVDPSGAEPTSLTLDGGAPVPVVPVGVLPTGALALPDRPTTVGWYAAGAAPGDPAGTAVLAGHVDSAVYGAGPLRQLSALHLGDVVAVTDAAGAVHRYAVASRRSYPKAALPAAVFRQDGPAQLALVTCGGAFDRHTGHYADNVVVIATAAGG